MKYVIALFCIFWKHSIAAIYFEPCYMKCVLSVINALCKAKTNNKNTTAEASSCLFFSAHYSLQHPLHLFEAIMVHSSLWKDSHPGWLLAWSVPLLPNDGKWSSTSILLLLSLMPSMEKGDWIAGMTLWDYSKQVWEMLWEWRQSVVCKCSVCT